MSISEHIEGIGLQPTEAKQREAALNLFISAVAAGKVEWKAETFAHDLIVGAETLVRYVKEGKTG
jgi:hypothetical protein